MYYVRSALFYVLLCLYCLFPCWAIAQLTPFDYSIQKEASGKNGAVVCAHPLGSQAGIMALQQGGNAIDAIISMQLVLAVVYPSAGNIGGGGFAVMQTADKKVRAFDFREVAPMKVNAHFYTDEAHKKLPYNPSREGILSAGVPGTVAGIFHMLPYAKLPLSTLIAPAITLAEKGFAITEQEAQKLNKYKAQFLLHNPSRKIAFLREGREWRAGDILIQKDLAHTLALIRDKGMAGFYEGENAQKIVQTMEAQKGVMSETDLKQYEVKEREPLAFAYHKDYTFFSMPPPSSGGIVLHQVLQMITAAMQQKMLPVFQFQDLLSVQLMVEAERRAYADRAVYMADPDFIKVPLLPLTDTAYLHQRIASFTPYQPSKNTLIKEGDVHESEETTHLSAVDKMGNIVSLTTTLNGPYGSFVVPQGTGFLLNNEMDDFTTRPGKPNLYGAVDGNNNLPAPAKRMLSSMTPTIVLYQGKPFLTVGTPGGTTIPTSVMQTVVNIIDYNMKEIEAITAPRFHFQRVPDVIFVEENYPAPLIYGLTKMGYKVKKRPSMGKVEAIRFLPSGELRAAADPRGDDAAMAY